MTRLWRDQGKRDEAREQLQPLAVEMPVSPGKSLIPEFATGILHATVSVWYQRFPQTNGGASLTQSASSLVGGGDYAHLIRVVYRAHKALRKVATSSSQC